MFGAILMIGFLIAAGYGWVMNIVSLANAEAFSGLVLMRAVGIIFAPLGAVLGYV